MPDDRDRWVSLYPDHDACSGGNSHGLTQRYSGIQGELCEPVTGEANDAADFFVPPADARFGG